MDSSSFGVCAAAEQRSPAELSSDVDALWCSGDSPEFTTAVASTDAKSSASVQSARYAKFYGQRRRLRRLFRFDVRYRCRRLHEVLAALGLSDGVRRVLDFGFGGGDLLSSFEPRCEVHGVEISASAVEAARADPRFGRFRKAEFSLIPGDRPNSMPEGPFDLIVSSHALEHVPDDSAVLRALRRRLAPGGVLALFVPIEEPDYIDFHVRNYSIQSIAERVERAGFELLKVEGSMYVNGHIWKLVTIPSRRHWPLVGPAVDALRLATLSALPHPLLRCMDELLYRAGFGARQALVVARARPPRS